MEHKLKTAYFAGLIDGEGSFGFWSSGNNYRRLEIKVNMTCKNTIEQLAKHFNCGTVTYIPPQKEGHKSQYKWRAKCKSARKVLIAIHPYLITKRKHCDFILSIPQRKRGRPKKGEKLNFPPKGLRKPCA